MRKRRTLRVAVLAATFGLGVVSATGGAALADDDPVVTTPSNVDVQVGTSSVTVEWDPSVSDAAEISIYHLKLNEQWYWTQDTSMTFHLPKSRTYAVTIKAQDTAYNRSDWSEPVEFTTSDEFPVTTPMNVEVDTAPGTVTVHWDPSASDAGVMDYVVILHGTNLGPIGHRTTGTTETFSYPPGGDLEVAVKARDQAYRWSDTSDPVSFTLPQAANWELPSTPGDFRATVKPGGGVLFEWDEPDQGVGPFRYHIALDGIEVDRVHGDLQLDSPYFTECRPWDIPVEITITASSYGFESPPSEPITLCLA